MKNENNYTSVECFNCKKIFKILTSHYIWKINKGQKSFCCSKICSKEIVKILSSKTQKGIPKSEEHNQKLIQNAKLNPNYGMKGKHHSTESCKIISIKLTGRQLSKQHIANIKKNIGDRRGKNCHFWKGGIAYLPYCYKFNKSFRESIRKRDGYICQLCGKTQEENRRRLSVHHIHGDKSNCYPDCISLCNRCNLVEVEKKDKRKYYENLFMNNLNDRGLLFWSRRNN